MGLRVRGWKDTHALVGAAAGGEAWAGRKLHPGRTETQSPRALFRLMA